LPKGRDAVERAALVEAVVRFLEGQAELRARLAALDGGREPVAMVRGGNMQRDPDASWTGS
jgi:hypothetical protein